MTESSSLDRQRVLVPIDFTEAARLALKTALRLARPGRDVVHLFYMPGFYAKTTGDGALGANASKSGAENAEKPFLTWAQSEGRTDVVVEMLPQAGVPDATVIADMAVRMRSTLIVLTRRKRPFWERLINGDLSERLPRVAPCPVHFVDPASETS